MASQFSILGSGSSGNSALLVTEHCKVLIDAGFSARKLGKMLNDTGYSLADIDAVFLTHEHGDHAAALTGFSRHPHLKIFANRGTATACQSKLKYRPAWQVFETGTTFEYRGLTVESFSVPHDAQEPVGFFFSFGHDDLFSRRRSLAWLTDLGYAPEFLRERIGDVDLLVIEANHDLELLKNDVKRPWSVKQRITGRHGHLSNEATCELLTSVSRPRWNRVCLCHLSRDCNSIEAVENTFSPFLVENSPFSLSVVAPGGATPKFELT